MAQPFPYFPPDPNGPTGASEFDQLAALLRILKETAASGSEPRVVQAFVEAFAVWHDAESWAYVRTLDGRYSRRVALPGTDASMAPAALDAPRCEAFGEEPVRLSELEQRALGFVQPQPLHLIRVPRRSGAAWLIVASLDRATAVAPQLKVCSEMLAQTLDEVVAIESSRLTWAMLQHLLTLGENEPLQRGAQLAVQEVAHALSGDARLTITGPEGSRSWSADASAHAAGEGWAGSCGLTLPVDAAAPFTAALTVRVERADATARHENLARTAAATLGAWLTGCGDRLRTGVERRRRSNGFEELVVRYASAAAECRRPASLLVLAVCAGGDPSLAAQLVSCLRRELRPTDLVGRLGAGEVGVLLLDTPEEGAQLVAERLQALFQSDGAASVFAGTTIQVRRV